MKKTCIILCAFLLVFGIAANGQALIWDNLEGEILVGSTVPGSPGNQDDAAWVQDKIDLYNSESPPGLPDLLLGDTGSKEEFETSLLDFDSSWLGEYTYISFKAANNLYLYYIADVVYPPPTSVIGGSEFYGWVFDRPELSHYTLWESDAAPVPEPSTILLLGVGMVGLAGLGRKRMKV